MIELAAALAPLWARIQPLLRHERLPQSFIFVGPRHAGILAFTNRLMATLLCQNDIACGVCRDCKMLLQGVHPDIAYIQPETPTSAIKIDKVRELQQDVYHTPLQGSRRFIVIQSAERMNRSAANALLKILEEPPIHTTFILLAEQVSTVPATLLSRCQKYLFPSANCGDDYLALGSLYPPQSPRSDMAKQAPLFTAALCEMIEKKTSPCTLAALWSSHAFDDLLWILYLLIAQAIHYQLNPGALTSKDNQFDALCRLLPTVTLFIQLDRINEIMLKINNNLNMNQTLVLETWLLGFLEDLQ